MTQVDLIYMAYNRLEFTQETFTALLKNTDWQYVHALYVYDDGSVDGTLEWLRKHIGDAPAPARLFRTDFHAHVTTILHCLDNSNAPILAKTDNDAMLPPGWLQMSLEVLDRHPELELLGIEAIYPARDDRHLVRSYALADFISGLGLYRRTAFRSSRPIPMNKYFGFEEWQMAQDKNRFRRGWINPAFPVFLLDRFPFEPWKTYSESYNQKGWQRPWTPYEPTCTLWRWRWPGGAPYSPANTDGPTEPGEARPPEFKVVILSRQAANLIPCVQSLLANEPDLQTDHILVVDDGARGEAEARLPGVQWVPGSRPFNYSRNANLGIRAAVTDVILLDDDARLITPYGFTRLAQQVANHESIGACSAGIRGVVFNPGQMASDFGYFRQEGQMLSFVCAYIPWPVFERIGPFDERFAGYGYADFDYCTRILAGGLRLAVCDECVVDHSGDLPSTFRTHPEIGRLLEQNRQLFNEKWEKNL